MEKRGDVNPAYTPRLGPPEEGRAPAARDEREELAGQGLQARAADKLIEKKAAQKHGR